MDFTFVTKSQASWIPHHKFINLQGSPLFTSVSNPSSPTSLYIYLPHTLSGSTHLHLIPLFSFIFREGLLNSDQKEGKKCT